MEAWAKGATCFVAVASSVYMMGTLLAGFGACEMFCSAASPRSALDTFAAAAPAALVLLAACVHAKSAASAQDTSAALRSAAETPGHAAKATSSTTSATTNTEMPRQSVESPGRARSARPSVQLSSTPKTDKAGVLSNDGRASRQGFFPFEEEYGVLIGMKGEDELRSGDTLDPRRLERFAMSSTSIDNSGPGDDDGFDHVEASGLLGVGAGEEEEGEEDFAERRRRRPLRDSARNASRSAAARVRVGSVSPERGNSDRSSESSLRALRREREAMDADELAEETNGTRAARSRMYPTRQAVEQLLSETAAMLNETEEEAELARLLNNIGDLNRNRTHNNQNDSDGGADGADGCGNVWLREDPRRTERFCMVADEFAAGTIDGDAPLEGLLADLGEPEREMLGRPSTPPTASASASLAASIPDAHSSPSLTAASAAALVKATELAATAMEAAVEAAIERSSLEDEISSIRRVIDSTQTEANVGATARQLEVNYLRTELAERAEELEAARGNLRQAQRTMSEQQSDHVPIAQNPILPLMVAERPRTIAETLAFTAAPVIVTTAEPPFRIVHTNAAWSQLCGWQSHEVLGSTCALLQGKATNRAHTAKLCESALKTGYAAAELINYKKDGTPFLNRIVLIPVVSQYQNGPRLTNTVGILDGTPLSGAMLAASMDTQHYAHRPQRALPMPPYDRGVSRDATVTRLSFDQLPTQAATLSVALDYMTYSSEPLILTDTVGRICSANKPWVDLCGYTCAEIEGQTCSILQGEETDAHAVEELNAKIRQGERAEATLVNYKKGNRRFVNNVVVLPLHSRATASGPDSSYFIARLREVGA